MKFNEDSVELTQEEAQEAIFDNEVQSDYDEPERWSRTAYVIVKLNNRFFEITYEQGLTEMQENEFLDGPTYPEVYPTDIVEVNSVHKYLATKPTKSSVLSQAKTVLDTDKLNELVKTLDFDDLDGTLALIKESQEKLKNFILTSKLTKYNNVVTLYLKELNELFAELKELKNNE